MLSLLSRSVNLPTSVRRLTLFVCAAILGCTEPLSPPTGQSPSERIAASILDGSHGGNGHFFFLPPLVSGSHLRFTGVSDPDQGPTVTVCEWNREKGGYCGAIIAQFGRDDGSHVHGTGNDVEDERDDVSPRDGSRARVIRYDAEDERYMVNWDTDQCATGPCILDPAKTYRLRVLVGSYELGHLDIDVVNKRSELKNVLTGEYIGLVQGRTLPIQFRIEKGAVSASTAGTPVTIGPAGGVVLSEDGTVALEFQNGSLSAQKAITIKSVAEPMLGDDKWSRPVNLGPDGTSFDKPVMLTLTFEGEKFPAGVPYDLLGIAVWRGDSWELVPNSVVNETDNTVTAPISHFSIYRVMLGYAKPAAGLTPFQVTVGGATTVFTTTTAYDVRPASYCRWETTRVRFLFFWTTRSRLVCYVVSQPYSYAPVGMRVYYFAVDPAWRPLAPDWTVHQEYNLPDGGMAWGYFPRDPYHPVYPTPSTRAAFDPPGYGVVQPGLVNGYAGVAISPPVRGLVPGAVHIAVQTGMELSYAWFLEVTCQEPRTISIQPTSARISTVSPGNTLQFSATNRDANGNVITCRPFAWGTGDNTIATVDANGLVTGHSPGTTTVSVGSPGYVAATAAVTVRSPSYVVGGFDFARGGVKSLAEGSYLLGFRTSIGRSYPSVEFAAFGTLSSSALSGIDAVVLAALRDNENPIAPLGTDEQAALRGFVARGGCAMLFAENSVNASSSNPGLLDPFGVTIAGILPGAQKATVLDPLASPVTNGPFGLISSFTENFPGGITSPGPYGAILATNDLGGALVVIPRGALGAGSGAVIVFSDATMLSSGAEGMYNVNEAVIMNAFAYCRA